MKYILPKISILIPISKDEFIDKVEKISFELGKHKTFKEYYPNSKDIERIKFEPQESKLPHEGLIGRLIFSNTKKSNLARISINARIWDKKSVTHELYVEAAVYIFEPIFKNYNLKFKSNIKLKIDRKKQYFDLLTPKMKSAFHYYLSIRKQYADPSETDFKNFYEFIRICHETRNKMTDSDILWLLIESGINKSESEEFANIYYHIRNYLNGGFRNFHNYGINFKEYNKKHNLK